MDRNDFYRLCDTHFEEFKCDKKRQRVLCKKYGLDRNIIAFINKSIGVNRKEKKISPNELENMKQMLSEGIQKKDIAQKLNVTTSTIQYYLKKWSRN